MIPRRNLSLLSNRLAQGGGRRLPEAVLERDYCIAWFLVGLATSPLRERLAFKGGTALKRCYFREYRFSEDLDFTLLQMVSLPELLAELGPLYQEIRRRSGVLVRLLREDRHPHANTCTIYLGYEGPLPGGGQEIKVDITVRERLVAPPHLRPLLRAYPEHSDLPEDARILVYPLSEIVTADPVILGEYDSAIDSLHRRLKEVREGFATGDTPKARSLYSQLLADLEPDIERMRTGVSQMKGALEHVRRISG